MHCELPWRARGREGSVQQERQARALPTQAPAPPGHLQPPEASHSIAGFSHGCLEVRECSQAVRREPIATLETFMAQVRA